VEVLLVPRLGYLVVKETRRVARRRPDAGRINVAGGAFQADMNDFSVPEEADELGLEKLGVVVQQINRWISGRLTTLNCNGCVKGNGLLLISGHS
jgi:hypothetical protein